MFHGGPRHEQPVDVNELDTPFARGKMTEFLDGFGAEKIDMRAITDRSGRDNHKLRVMFEINDRDHAQGLYDMVGLHKQNHLKDTDNKMQIYFLLPESLFESYADKAAELYYEEEKKLAEKNAQRKEQWEKERVDYKRMREEQRPEDEQFARK